MLATTRTAVILVSVAALLAVPTTASAAIDVTRDAATGGLRVSGGDDAEVVTLTRAEDATLRVTHEGGVVASSDAACTIDALTGVASCAAPSASAVAVDLGGGSDRLDTTAAIGVVLSVSGGSGADTMRIGSSGTTTVTSTDALDTFDLAHAANGARARFETAAARVVVRCAGCASSWAVHLPTQPKGVILGAGDDEVDLRTWRARGATTWTTGAGKDLLLGSPVHRSTFNAGPDSDKLVSWAAADTLLGGPGTDKLADLGGTGDVLDGGADIDVMVSLDGKHDTMRGGAGRDMCPSLRRGRSTCDSSGRVSGFEMNTYVPSQDPKIALRMVGIRL